MALPGYMEHIHSFIYSSVRSFIHPSFVRSFEVCSFDHSFIFIQRERERERERERRISNERSLIRSVFRLFETDFKLHFFRFKFSVSSMKTNYKTKANSDAFNKKNLGR